jgi:glycine cleavage system H protein
MNVPEDLRYTESHEWVRVADGVATVGITDHAQEELSELVYVELPEAGKAVSKGDPAAVVESVKAASDIYAPVGGEVVAGNELLDGEPAKLNGDPYGDGWIFQMKIGDESELDSLLDAAAYKAHIG